MLFFNIISYFKPITLNVLKMLAVSISMRELTPVFEPKYVIFNIDTYCFTHILWVLVLVSKMSSTL